MLLSNISTFEALGAEIQAADHVLGDCSLDCSPIARRKTMTLDECMHEH